VHIKPASFALQGRSVIPVEQDGGLLAQAALAVMPRTPLFQSRSPSLNVLPDVPPQVPLLRTGHLRLVVITATALLTLLLVVLRAIRPGPATSAGRQDGGVKALRTVAAGDRPSEPFHFAQRLAEAEKFIPAKLFTPHVASIFRPDQDGVLHARGAATQASRVQEENAYTSGMPSPHVQPQLLAPTAYHHASQDTGMQAEPPTVPPSPAFSGAASHDTPVARTNYDSHPYLVAHIPRAAPSHHQEPVQRANATVCILARNREAEDLKNTLRSFEETFNHRYNYPYVFLVRRCTANVNCRICRRVLGCQISAVGACVGDAEGQRVHVP
jgi:hypothetical protein